MAGHSKWANIKHRKGAVDKKRGHMFHRLGKEIMVAAKLGGSDITTNNRLRIAVARARAGNMPRDTIERAVKRGAGELEGQNFEEIRYEIFAPGGVGIIVEALTDKKSRTTPEIKSLINKHGANLAEPGAVSHLFQRKGEIIIDKNSIAEDQLMEIVLDSGADDMKSEDDYYEVLTSPENFGSVLDTLSGKEITTRSAEIKYLPLDGTEIEISDEEKAQKILGFIDILEEHDDVQALFTNLNVSDDIAEKMASS